MALRKIGLNSMDFADMSLSEMYLRFCIEVQEMELASMRRNGGK